MPITNTSNPYVTPARWHDQQYGAAFYIFNRLPRCFAYVCKEGIEKAQLLEDSRAWSHGEQILVKIALDLFDPGCVRDNGAEPAGWGEAAGTLDSRNIEIAINAVRIARGELKVNL